MPTATTHPTGTLEQVLATATGPNAAPLAEALTEALDTGPSGTMRSWMEARHGRFVDTVQVSPLGPWAPLGRQVNASRASYVQLGGSRRDYAHMRVIGATDRALVVADADDVVLYADSR